MNWNLNETIFNQLYWYGQNGDALEKETLLFFDCFRFTIWKFKMRKTLLNPVEAL
jgi:hypothetical protein